MARVKQLTVLSGLPGSGKSFKAEELLRANKYAMRVNKDLLREMFHFSTYDATREQTVVQVEYSLVEWLLEDGHDVIVDDTNFNPKHMEKYQAIAEEEGATLQVIRMENDVELCIKRDAKRAKNYKVERSVGADVIKNMAYKNGILAQLRPIAVVNLDVLSDAAHRQHYIKNANITNGSAKPDWPGFYSQCYRDQPINANIAKLVEYKEQGYEIVLVCSYPEQYRGLRTKWLEHYQVPFDRMLMRPDGNYEKDEVLKKKMLDNYINKDMVEIWIDDRPVIIKMIKANGIKIEQVGSGIEY